MTRFFTPAVSILSFCTLQLLGACSPGAEDSPVATLSAESAAALATESIADCVSQQIAQNGNDPAAVTALDCAMPASQACSSDATEDVSSLSTLTNLRELDLSGRCLADMRPLAALTKLQRLELANNRVGDIRPLAALRELEYLNLENNQLVDTWGTETQEPFSSWTKLRELDLDGTGIENALPLWRLRSLETLSIRNSSLWSLRQLGRLTELRRLHADGSAFIEDLSSLAGFLKLEELSVEYAHIHSIEPLRVLLSGTGAGRLRKVSLRGNFVPSCMALQGIEYDCSEQQSGWVSLVTDAPSLGISSPVELVEAFAPTDLPIWTRADMARGFELIRNAPIRWDQPNGGCDTRAYQSAALLASSGFQRTTTAHAFGNLRPLTTNFPTGYVSFDWHIALAVRGELEGNGSGIYVFDPALNDERPLLLREWFARLVDSAGQVLDYSCSVYGQYNQDPRACNPADNRVALDEQGNLQVDDVRELFGLVCPSGTCSTL